MYYEFHKDEATIKIELCLTPLEVNKVIAITSNLNENVLGDLMCGFAHEVIDDLYNVQRRMA